jgi:hypothetical protein
MPKEKDKVCDKENRNHLQSLTITYNHLRGLKWLQVIAV